MYPSARKSAEDRKKVEGGVVCHFHGGGWVVSSLTFPNLHTLEFGVLVSRKTCFVIAFLCVLWLIPSCIALSIDW